MRTLTQRGIAATRTASGAFCTGLPGALSRAVRDKDVAARSLQGWIYGVPGKGTRKACAERALPLPRLEPRYRAARLCSRLFQ